MTHRYSARNQHDLLYEIARAYPGGIEALALRMNTTAKKLYKKLSPKSTERNTTAEEFSLIVEMCAGANVKNAMSPIEALCWRHGGVFVPLDSIADTSDEGLRKTGINAFVQLSNVASLVEQTEEFDDHAMEKIVPAKWKLGAAVAAYFAGVRARHESRKALKLAARAKVAA
jgi:hypothetical protein